MEDVHELMHGASEDKSLVWIDSSRRDEGGTGSSYTVTMAEPIRNVVGLRVIEAIVPATIMSVDQHNCTLSVHTVAFNAELDVEPSHVLAVHTASPRGEAWRSHGAAGKVTYYDEHHDVQHHVAHEAIKVYRARPEQEPRALSAGETDGVVCTFEGDVAKRFAGSVYDPVAMATVVFCAWDATMDFVTEVDVIAGVYTLPHGKYDSLRDFAAELTHQYSPLRTGVSMGFLRPISGKPERTLRMQIDPALVWTTVDTTPSAGYPHTYPSKARTWCAVWKGSSALNVVGFHSNATTLQTAGGDFATSDTHARYNGRLRGVNMVNLASERYVWLRCPELESHMCAGVGQVLQRGIGVFRLDVPGVLNQDKTDYLSVIPGRFHPIAKLSRLSFRFDRGSRENEPYDFRGIDHFMLVAVTTLRPDRAKIYKSLPCLLNPDYAPNAMMFQMAQEDARRNVDADSARGADQGALTGAQIRRVVTIHNSALGRDQQSAQRGA